MDKYDEYKFFTERVQHRSDRRQQASQIYLTVNTAIFGIIALLVKDSGLAGWSLAVITLPLLIIGVLVCLIWFRIIKNFGKIIEWQYEQLRELETLIKDSHKMHTKEWEKFYRPNKTKPEFSFSNMESQIPLMFMGLYIIVAVSITIAVIFKML